jgi:hypothetical protein
MKMLDDAIVAVVGHGGGKGVRVGSHVARSRAWESRSVPMVAVLGMRRDGLSLHRHSCKPCL